MTWGWGIKFFQGEKRVKLLLHRSWKTLPHSIYYRYIFSIYKLQLKVSRQSLKAILAVT